MIKPYDSYNISQIPTFITDVLTRQHLSPLWELRHIKVPESINKVLFILVDGFGNRQWKELSPALPVLRAFNESDSYNVIQTTFPSSTPVALTTLYSGGATPSQHALTDWWVYDMDIDSIIASLPFSTMEDTRPDSLRDNGYDPHLLYSSPTFYETLEQAGVLSSVFMKSKYRDSSYTSVTQRGGELYSFSRTSKDMFNSLYKVIKSVKPNHLLYAYWGDIDEAGHTTGPSSRAYREQVASFAHDFEVFVHRTNPTICEETLCIITSDHGQIDVLPEKTFYLDSIQGFHDLLRMSPKGKTIFPWGGVREVFIAIKDGMIDDAWRTLSAALEGKAQVIKTEDALRAGLFGPLANLHPKLRSRIGDILVLPLGNSTIWYHHPSGMPITTLGQHGGLTSAEMEVPFAVARLSDIKQRLLA